MTALFKSFPRACPGPAPGRGIDGPTCTGTEPPATQEFTMPLKNPFPSGRRAPWSALAALAATMTIFVSGTVSAQGVQNPPRMPQNVIVFPERDFTSITGFAPKADLLVQVMRNKVLINDATGTTDTTGFLEVNHPGGVCWNIVTPNIGPEDVVLVTYANTTNNKNRGLGIGSGGATTTRNVTAKQAYDDQLPGQQQGNVVIKGNAQLVNGSQIPLNQFEVRIVNPDFIDPPNSRIGKRDIRADITGGRIDGADGKPIPNTKGSLAYDSNTGTSFTATFTGLTASERKLAVEGQTRVIGWQATSSAGDRLGMTIYEVGAFGGPGMGGCPPGPNGVKPPVNPTAPVHYRPDDLLDAANSDLSIQSLLKNVIVFPERDFVSITGFDPGTNLQVVVRRNSKTQAIGMARGFVNSGGLFEVNHPGGVCWSGQTPDIRPGDLIDVLKVSDTTYLGGQTQRVIDTTIKTTAYRPPNDTVFEVRVEGTAVDANNSPLALDFIEQRIINRDFTTTRVGRRDIRADLKGGRVVPGGSGYLSPTGGGGWTAVYSGLNATEAELATAGDNRAMAWLSTNTNGDRFGVTIYEAGQVGGPMGGCPATGSASIAIP